MKITLKKDYISHKKVKRREVHRKNMLIPPKHANSLARSSILHPRQQGPAGSSNDLSGGAIAGIVIGSIIILLLLVWVIRLYSQPTRQPTYYYVTETRRPRRGRSRHNRRRSAHVRSPARVYTRH